MTKYAINTRHPLPGPIEDWLMKFPQQIFWTALYLCGRDLKKIPSYYALEIDGAMVDNWVAMISIPNRIMLENIRNVFERGDPEWHKRPDAMAPIAIPLKDVMAAVGAGELDNFQLTAVIPVLSTYYYHYNYRHGKVGIVDGWQPMEQQTLAAEPKKQMVFNWAIKLKRK